MATKNTATKVSLESTSGLKMLGTESTSMIDFHQENGEVDSVLYTLRDPEQKLGGCLF